MSFNYTLQQLGWQPFFQQQLSLEEWQQGTAARIFSQHRSVLEILTEQGTQRIDITPSMPAMTVGDWILLDDQQHFLRLLDRSSVFSRKAAGTQINTQLIAANIDTVFIVSSLNQDFNLSRIERYLAMTHEAGVEAVIVLSKADLCAEDPQSYVEQLRRLDNLLEVLIVNGLDSDSVAQLSPWCQTGKTIAFMGSSGVGKSTLVNSLMGSEVQFTQSIREDDAKGRHTTTGRTLHVMPSGGLLLDTPGMRELQLLDCAEGLEATFADIVDLATQCRFSDCQHQSEPGCAVKQAIENGSLDQRRLKSYQKLLREQAFNSASVAEKRAQSRNFAKYVKQVQSGKPY